jgi:hypothetical protein
MMATTKARIFLATLVLAAAAATELRAQNIVPLVTKTALDANEKADISVWVNKRATRLTDADPKEIKDIVDDFLDVVTKQAPSPVFAAEYASQCGDHLGGVTGQAAPPPINQLRALAAVRILRALDQPKTSGGLATALQSPYPGVRLIAAKAIQELHTKLKDAVALETVLTALGDAAATESSSYVLPELYKALDFKAADPKFAHGNFMAGALAKAFSGRATRLAQGARDEDLDMAGLNAAASVAPDASATNRKQLGGATISLMAQYVDRYLDPQTNPNDRPHLKRLTAKAEDIISRLVTKANDSPPGELVSELMTDKPDAKAVRERLAKWQAAAAGL